MAGRTTLAVIAAVALFTGTALALATDGTTFKQLYSPKAGTKVAAAGCLLCHEGAPFTKTGLNPYGLDLARQPKPRTAAAFKAIEKLDSDKDGFTNLAEIQAGTLPGDPASKPSK